MHERYTINPGPDSALPCPPLGIQPEDIPPSTQSAPPDWRGTPMEMAADAFGMDSPWKHRLKNRDMHRRKMQERWSKRNKAARKARKRNRR